MRHRTGWLVLCLGGWLTPCLELAEPCQRLAEHVHACPSRSSIAAGGQNRAFRRVRHLLDRANAGRLGGALQTVELAAQRFERGRIASLLERVDQRAEPLGSVSHLEAEQPFEPFEPRRHVGHDLALMCLAQAADASGLADSSEMTLPGTPSAGSGDFATR